MEELRNALTINKTTLALAAEDYTQTDYVDPSNYNILK